MPVVEPGTLALALPLPADASSEIALGDLLSDALFGEVIDISDLIPSVLSPSAEVAVPQPVADVAGIGLGVQDAGDVAVASSDATGVLTILYDDDILASDQTIL